MYDAGIGETSLNALLSEINIPSVPHTTLKRYERKVSPVIMAVADDTCQESILAEKELTLQALKSDDR